MEFFLERAKTPRIQTSKHKRREKRKKEKKKEEKRVKKG